MSLPPLLTDTLDAAKAAWPLLTAGAALLVPGVRHRLRGWLRDTPSEFAAQMCAAHLAESAKLDAVFVRAHERVMPLLRPHIDAEYAPVMQRREATERTLTAAVEALREQLRTQAEAGVRPLADLTQGVRDLTHEVRGLAGAVGELRSDHKQLAGLVGDTREELAAYAGENNRRHRARRADDRPA